jgi:hypothetical protein
LNKGITNFTRNHPAGITTANGINYASPAPAVFMGAFGTK